MPTIPDLRHRIWTAVGNAIQTSTDLNAILYRGKEDLRPEMPQPEDTSDGTIAYIQKGIDTYNAFAEVIKQKTRYLTYLKSKNDECLNVLNTEGG